MLVRVTTLLGVLLALSGCSSADRAKTAFPDGTSMHTMAFGGLDRTYRVYKPAGLTAAAPLVVMLHGGFGNGEQAENSYGWDPLADSAKFVVAYPDGVGRTWNGHGCCGRPRERTSTTSALSPRWSGRSALRCRSTSRGSTPPG
ncbi:MAG TPA: PHB depolymerase family esterase, partial [Mycobacterium sp.]|nr:PHB depolymerase family esterase [Mycobacterium sp.]